MRDGPWQQVVGLEGELFDYVSLPTSSSLWLPAAMCAEQYSGQALVWYRLSLPLQLNADPAGVFSLNLASMNKGQAFVNGHAIGRYWTLVGKNEHDCAPCDYAGKFDPAYCRTGCGSPSQFRYHVPRAWLMDGANDVTLIEELAGSSPQSVFIERMNSKDK